jgi:hypothetical protein
MAKKKKKCKWIQWAVIECGGPPGNEEWIVGEPWPSKTRARKVMKNERIASIKAGVPLKEIRLRVARVEVREL